MSSVRWALITGVSEGGLGDALTTAFLSQNISVIATNLDVSLLSYLPSNEKLQQVQLDVTSQNSISQALEQVTSITGGKLDFLINNAGYGYMIPLLDAPISDFKRQYDVNVFGLLAVTQAFFPLLRAAKGMVVNQSSIASLRAGCQPFIGSYSSSKAAVTALSNTMRVEFAPFDVKVVTLVTGDVRTEFWRNASKASGGLPDSSIYAPIKSAVEPMMRGETNPPGGHSREVWAKNIVSDVLKRNPSPFVRRGYLAVVVWLVSVVVPTWLIDMGFYQRAKLDILKKTST